jgi:hypothetical protein
MIENDVTEAVATLVFEAKLMAVAAVVAQFDVEKINERIRNLSHGDQLLEISSPHPSVTALNKKIIASLAILAFAAENLAKCIPTEDELAEAAKDIFFAHNKG